jgi:hypothetical protein
MTVFVDTSAVYAVSIVMTPATCGANDLDAIGDEDATLVTTNYVLMETSALFQRRLGWRIAGVS